VFIVLIPFVGKWEMHLAGRVPICQYPEVFPGEISGRTTNTFVCRFRGEPWVSSSFLIFS